MHALQGARADLRASLEHLCHAGGQGVQGKSEKRKSERLKRWTAKHGKGRKGRKGRKAERKGEYMIRRIDRYWFRLLAAVNGWVVRRARAHCRRETLRRLVKCLERQKPHLN